MKLTYLFKTLLILITVFTLSCDDDETSGETTDTSSEETSDTTTDNESNEGIELSSSDITENIPQSVLDDQTLGPLITGLTSSIDAQFGNFTPNESSVKTPAVFDASPSSNSCLDNTLNFTDQFSWTDVNFNYIIYFGEDSEKNFWRYSFTGNFDGGSSSSIVDAVEYKNKLAGCVYSEVDGVETIRIAWSQDNSGNISYIYAVGGVESFTMLINSDGSGSMTFGETTYTWNAIGDLEMIS